MSIAPDDDRSVRTGGTIINIQGESIELNVRVRGKSHTDSSQPFRREKCKITTTRTNSATFRH
ncbi:hypothetical protein BLOT_007287 [Blomia tropicalis]|nr:hypothetical protein BLOT_007287 [Blomia tropicalis]